MNATTSNSRLAVINAYESLDDAITEYYDDFRPETLTLIYHCWIQYAAACIDAGEGYFALQDIFSDDMAEIPSGYPAEAPNLPQLAGSQVGSMFDTPRARRMMQSLLRGLP